jgi:hypothetical protein
MPIMYSMYSSFEKENIDRKLEHDMVYEMSGGRYDSEGNLYL